MPRSASQNKIWDPAESMPLKEMHELQLQRLRACIARASKVPFYHELFRQRGLTLDSIKTLDDIRRYPFTNKVDLRQHYPLGMMAVPRESLARIHGSSGTTGKPTFVGYTQEDLDIWAGLCARFLVAGGLCSHHIVHVAFGYGLFTGGFGLHYGIEKTGAAVVPVASGNTLRQIMLTIQYELIKNQLFLFLSHRVLMMRHQLFLIYHFQNSTLMLPRENVLLPANLAYRRL